MQFTLFQTLHAYSFFFNVFFSLGVLLVYILACFEILSSVILSRCFTEFCPYSFYTDRIFGSFEISLRVFLMWFNTKRNLTVLKYIISTNCIIFMSFLQICQKYSLKHSEPIQSISHFHKLFI